MKYLLFFLVLVLGAADQSPGRTAWAQGRPEEALGSLIAEAKRSDSWADWNDAGLCAAAAGKQPVAVFCLLKAQNRAPLDGDSRRALAILAPEVPSPWTSKLGPLAVLGQGWTGGVFLTLGGILLTWGLFRRRLGFTVIGALGLVLALPGHVAHWHDAYRPYAVLLQESSLTDASGHQIAAIPTGTVVQLPSHPRWNDRVKVECFDGRQGFLAQSAIAALTDPGIKYE
jgi:hypothetical protein